MQDPRQLPIDPLPMDPAAAERELHEQVGYVRCQLDAVRARLAELQRRKDQLEHHLQHELEPQLEVVQSEVDARRKEIEERLGEWCALDELDQRHMLSAALIKRVDAIRTSSTYRITAALLLVVNKARRIVTLSWLRRRAHP